MPSSATITLAQELIRKESVTPADAGCQELIAARLRPIGFVCEPMNFEDVTNLWATRGEARPLVVFAGHTDEVARRIAEGLGKSRTGTRIKAAVLDALIYSRKQGDLNSISDFWFTGEQAKNVPIRDRSEAGSPTNKAEYLSDMEIQAAAQAIEGESGRVEPDELVRSIAPGIQTSRA